MEITIKIDVEEMKKILNVETPKEQKVNPASMYGRFFDYRSLRWFKDPITNRRTLRVIQDHANDILKARGYIFLNEVYDLLDIPKTPIGQVVGWTYNKGNPLGDNYVDFDVFNSRNSDFINGITPDVMLDFNVDGIILDYI